MSSMNMRSVVKTICTTIICAVLWLGLGTTALAQTGTRTVTITYEDKVNPSGTVYNILRATGLCTGTPTFSVIATAVAALTYQDKSAQIGNNYCYAATATYNGTTSSQSNTALATILPSAPNVTNIQIAMFDVYIPPREGLITTNGLFGIEELAVE